MEEHVSSRSDTGLEPITLLLVGGGIRFPAFIGALKAVEQMGVPIRRVVGASTGGIVAALYAAGFSPDDIQQQVLAIDTARFRDFKPRGLLKGMGFCAGDVLEQWLDARLDGRTLGEPGRVPLGLIATDILNHAPHLLTGDSCPGLKVSTAVRFSAGIPLVFTWKKFVNRGREHIFIDGSLMANIVETQCAESGRTLVIKTFSRRSMGPSGSPTLTFRRYGADLLTIFSHAMDREFLKGGRWRDTITIHCGAVSPISFSLSGEEKAFLFEQGYQQTVKYLRYKWGL